MIDIIFVDDQKVESFMFKTLLKTANIHDIELVCFEDPEMALEYIKEGGVNFVITDFNMPQMNGDEFAIKIKQYEPEIKIFLRSHETLDFDKYIQFDDRIDKDFLPNDVSKILEFVEKIRGFVKLKEELKELYNEMADLTKSQCEKDCSRVNDHIGSCCDPMYCALAIQRAKKDGILIAKTGYRDGNKSLPCMGENGCIVEPYYRPTCVVHVCEKSLFNNREFEDKYFKLRNKIEEIEYKHWSKK